MAHELDLTTGTAAVFVTAEPAWHGLGRCIDAAATSADQTSRLRSAVTSTRSGPTQAACKTLTLRLKGSGMTWDRDHAAAMMNLTALSESGQAAAYWARAA